MPFFNTTRLSALEAQPKAIPQHLILIVDDEAANRQAIRALLGGQYQLLEAADGQEALNLIEQLPNKNQLACIISDQRMPNVTGVELFERLLPLLPRAIRIIVTGFIDVDAIVNAVNRAHIYQFFIKPFDPNDFILTIKRAIEAFELNKKLDAYHAQLEVQVAECSIDMAGDYRNLKLPGFTDSLTGLPKRAFLFHTMASHTANNEAIEMPLFMLLDIDNLPSLKEQHGQLAVDQLLLQISQRLAPLIEPSENLIRWRNGEFLFVLSASRQADICTTAERIRTIINANEFILSEQIPVHLTCSIGFAWLPFSPLPADQLDDDAPHWTQLIQLAEQALFMAKQGGQDAWAGFLAPSNWHKQVSIRQLLYATAQAVAAGQLQIASNLIPLQRNLP